MHSTSLRRGNSSVVPDGTEQPGLQEDEEKLWNVLEEDTRIEQTHAATEPYFKSDSTSPPPALSEDQDNVTKRPDSLRKRRSVGHRDINKLSNLLSKQQEALVNTYVSSSPQEIVLHFQFRQPLLLIQSAKVEMLSFNNFFLSLAALEVVKMTTSSAAIDDYFIQMTTFLFKWISA